MRAAPLQVLHAVGLFELLAQRRAPEADLLLAHVRERATSEIARGRGRDKAGVREEPRQRARGHVDAGQADEGEDER